MIDFGQVVTAMVTPLKEDGSINYEVAEKLAVFLLENGSDALLICGTTGESPTLIWEEECELFKVVKRAVVGKGKIIAGTGSNSTKEAIAATQKAAELGLDGSLQVVPYYNKPPQAGLYAHFQEIAVSCQNLPIMLYNIPSRTGQNLLPETVARLAEIPNIVAIKEASGNLNQVSKIRTLTTEEFTIYSGDDSLTMPILSIGGEGVVSVASHLVGNEIQQMISAFKTGEIEKAIALHRKLFPLFQALFTTTNPIPIKAALRLKGWDVGRTRLPLAAESDESLEETLKTVVSR